MRTKVVFDTNIYLAGALSPDSYSRSWLRVAARERRSFDLISSESIIDEIKRKMLQKMAMPPELVAAFEGEIRDAAVIVAPVERLSVITRDPSDDIILECAVAGQAEMIISADRDLLQLRQYRSIGIYHPSNLKYFFPSDLDRST